MANKRHRGLPKIAPMPAPRSYPWGSFPVDGDPIGDFAHVTRRAVIPNMMVQIYTSSPMLGLLWNKGKAPADV